MANTFDWIEIKTRNMEETANFYENLFGWKIIRKEDDYWIFDTGDSPRVQNIQRGGIWLRPDSENLGVVVYIAVDDIETVLKKVTELGGKPVIQDPTGLCF